MAKLIITADWHLGYRQYGLESREEDFYKAAWDVLKIADRQKVDAIILAGDILHVNRPSSRVIQEIVKMHVWAQNKRLPIFYILGNHDMAEPDWLTTTCNLRSNDYGFINLDTITNVLESALVKDISVCGLSYRDPEQLLIDLKKLKPADILVLHQPIKEMCGFASAAYPSVNDLPIGKYKLIALGDIHINQVQNINGKDGWSWVGYPGSTEMNSGSENPDKYCWEVELTNNSAYKETPNLTYHLINTRKVFSFTLTEEEQESNLYKTVDEANPGRGILYINYPSNWNGFMQRVLSKYREPKFICRFNPVDNVTNSEIELAMANNMISKETDVEASNIPMHIRLPVEKVLESVLPSGSILFKVASGLMQREAQHVQIIDEYIDSRSKELGIN